MAVELWNDKTRNLIADFDSEADALTYLRQMIDLHGEQSVARWALEIDDDSPMIRGEQLLQLVSGVTA